MLAGATLAVGVIACLAYANGTLNHLLVFGLAFIVLPPQALLLQLPHHEIALPAMLIAFLAAMTADASAQTRLRVGVDVGVARH